MSIAGFIAIAFLLIGTLGKRNDAKSAYRFVVYFYIFCSLFFGVGKVFSTGIYDFDYSEFALTIFFFVTLVFHFAGKIKVCGKVFVFFLTFEISLLIGLLLRLFSDEVILGTDHTIVTDDVFLRGASLVNIGVTSYSWFVFIKVSMFLYSSICAFGFLGSKDVSWIAKKLVAPSAVFLGFCCTEFAISNLIDPLFVRRIVMWVFGVSKTMVLTPYYRIGVYSILATSMEPSAVCFTLFVIINVFLWNISLRSYGKKTFSLKVGVFLSCVLALSTFALTSLFVVAYTIVIVIGKSLKNHSSSSAVLLFLFADLAALLMISFFGVFSGYLRTRLGVLPGFISAYFENPYGGVVFEFRESLAYRMYSILNAAGIFARHPIFGIGLGTATSFSGLFYTLADIGLVGFCFCLLFWRKAIQRFALCDGRLVLILYVIFLAFFGSINNFVCSSLSFCVCVGGSSYFYDQVGFSRRDGSCLRLRTQL